MRDIVRSQIDSLKETLRLQERTQQLLRRGLVSLLRDSVGDTTPVTFNDETGLPAFRDFSEGEVPVVAVRVGIVNGERVLQINNSCGDDEYGLDPDGWFNPDDYGVLNSENLLSCIESALERIAI